MPVKWHGATRLRAKGHRAEEGRAPPLTSLRACGGARLTDGTGTQGQAGRASRRTGALYHSLVGNPRAGRRSGTGGWFTASGCESRGRQGIPAPVTLSPVRGFYGRLYGGTVATWRPGCGYEDKNLLISEKRGKPL